LDETMLQSYFDGELSIELMERATSHLASCAICAAAAREMEEESALLTSALAVEFEASVPTERLRQRIDEAVLGERLAVASSTEKKAGFFATLLAFGTQRTLGYASLVVVMAFAAIFGVVKMKMTEPSVTTPAQPGVPEVAEVRPARAPQQDTVPVEITVPDKPRNSITPRPIRVSKSTTATTKQAPVKLLPGERSYLQTIARLDSTIKAGKKNMRPSLQVEYERNLAVVDRAIAATRSAAKSNPNDPDAADFMFAAYQSKVDLLNTIADARLGGGRGH
jgi:anti-sigma factor RsiW